MWQEVGGQRGRKEAVNNGEGSARLACQGGLLLPPRQFLCHLPVDKLLFSVVVSIARERKGHLGRPTASCHAEGMNSCRMLLPLLPLRPLLHLKLQLQPFLVLLLWLRLLLGCAMLDDTRRNESG